MKTFHFIPDSSRTAATQLRIALAQPLENLPTAVGRAFCAYSPPKLGGVR